MSLDPRDTLPFACADTPAPFGSFFSLPRGTWRENSLLTKARFSPWALSPAPWCLLNSTHFDLQPIPCSGIHLPVVLDLRHQSWVSLHPWVCHQPNKVSPRSFSGYGPLESLDQHDQQGERLSFPRMAGEVSALSSGIAQPHSGISSTPLSGDRVHGVVSFRCADVLVPSQIMVHLRAWIDMINKGTGCPSPEWQEKLVHLALELHNLIQVSARHLCQVTGFMVLCHSIVLMCSFHLCPLSILLRDCFDMSVDWPKKLSLVSSPVVQLSEILVDKRKTNTPNEI